MVTEKASPAVLARSAKARDDELDAAADRTGPVRGDDRPPDGDGELGGVPGPHINGADGESEEEDGGDKTGAAAEAGKHGKRADVVILRPDLLALSLSSGDPRRIP